MHLRLCVMCRCVRVSIFRLMRACAYACVCVRVRTCSCVFAYLWTRVCADQCVNDDGVVPVRVLANHSS
jgi:hypothetical protein